MSQALPVEEASREFPLRDDDGARWHLTSVAALRVPAIPAFARPARQPKPRAIIQGTSIDVMQRLVKDGSVPRSPVVAGVHGLQTGM